MMNEEWRNEVDALKDQLAELQARVFNIEQMIPSVKLSTKACDEAAELRTARSKTRDVKTVVAAGEEASGAVYYAGQVQAGSRLLRWEPKERQLEHLLRLNTEKLSKVLPALGSKPRLDMIVSTLKEPLSGSELVERLNMGTTGQLYHHLKALQAADLATQDKDGRYGVPDRRKLPLLLLLAAVADMMDASDFLDMEEARSVVGSYLGPAGAAGYDANLLLWAVMENVVLEHKAGYATELHVFLHRDGSATVADNGRGIPVRALPSEDRPAVQTVLTDIGRFQSDAPFQVSGAERGVSISVVNALSVSLTVEVQREGYRFRQDYQRGIPQTELVPVGVSSSTGTSITFKPDPQLFGKAFDGQAVRRRLERMRETYAGLNVRLHKAASEAEADR